MQSIYIHVPFCKTICTYCDFCKFYYHEKWVKDYLKALDKELDSIYQGEILETIYIGGGTPNALTIEELKELFKIVNKVNKAFIYGFTVECNIEYITEEQLKLFKDNGVNRLSIGVQTLNDKYIKILGRHHNYQLVLDKIQLVKEYFDNINIDLMYALPNQTLDELRKDLEIFLKLDVPHISTYSLMLEPHTKLYIDKLQPIDDEIDYQMYKLIKETLKENNYCHYEISNFAKKGYESKHNLTYWNNKEYYGLGMGASGYIDNTRYDNTKTLNQYLNGNYVANRETLDYNSNVENAFILGLRKIKGLNKKEFLTNYHLDIKKIDVVNELIKKGKLVDDGENIYIEESFLYLSNDILVMFLGVDYEKYRIQ